MKKIFFFISDYKLGVTTLLAEQALSLSKLTTLEFVFIGGSEEQEPGLINKLKSNKINPVLTQNFDAHSEFFKKFSFLWEKIKYYKPDHIHVQNNWQLLIITLIKLFTFSHFKIVYTIHGYRHNFRFRSYITKWAIMIFVLLFADSVIAPSSFVRNKFYLIKYKTKVIFLGIDDSYFVSNSIPMLKKNDIRIIFAGQFRHGKNQFEIISAFSKFIKKQNDTSFTLILPGNGPLRSYCLNYVNYLGLGKRIFFPGQLSKQEVFNLYSTSNIALIASNTETFGQCISEPFSQGLCVITKKVGVASDIIKHKVNGFFFSSEREIEPILSILSNDPEIIPALGQKAFESRDQFKWENIAQQFLSIYL